MPDAGDPRVYLAGATEIVSEYPQAVMEAISDPRSGTRVLKDYPSLRDLRAACDELYAPIAREAERQEAHESHQMALPPPRYPRTPEQQARIDRQVEEARRQVGAGHRHAPSGRLASIQPWRGDGKHAERIASDIAARRARREIECG